MNKSDIIEEKGDKNQGEKVEPKSREEMSSILVATNRIKIEDKMFFSSQKKGGYYYIENLKYENYFFVRGVATKFLFEGIDFSKVIFDSCYLKNCRFIRCTFEGGKFMNCNLQGSYFEDCNFKYVIFEKTFVDDEIFECAPKEYNLRYKFARSLKLNYASVGDYIKSTKAVTLELEATKKHLLNSWLSSDEWNKAKYSGIKRRAKQFWKWFKVSLLDFVWGNGESLWRLVRFNILIFIALTIYHIVENSLYGATNLYGLFRLVVIQVPANYFGITVGDGDEINIFDYYPTGLKLILILSRLICFGLLMSIIIKKYNRR